MNKGLYLGVFVAGVIAGSAATWCCVKKKYEKIAQEEIDSVKEAFAKKKFDSRVKEMTKAGEEVVKGLNDGIRQTAEQAKDKPDLVQYAAMVQKYRGTIGREKEADEVDDGKQPYVITPDEFGENDEYERISLTYYADGVLANDDDEIIRNPESVIGDGLYHFGEYEEDSVFVRNDELRCDYEILLDKRSFSEVTGMSQD